MDGSPDRATVDGPARRLDAQSHEHSGQARETLASADSAAYLLDLDRDDLERMVHEQPFAEVSRALNAAQTIARDLRVLAEEFDIARNALRDQLSMAIERHDKQSDSDTMTERPRLVPASSGGRGQTEKGPGRGY